MGVPPLTPLTKDEASGRKHPVHQAIYERYDTPVIIFLTVCSKWRKAIFANAEAHDVLCRAWRQAKNWQVGRYVIMPDHIHLFCAPDVMVTQSLECWVAFWKSGAARHWPRRDDAPIWQRHFWDTKLRRGESYDSKWDYVLENPVRAGLVTRPENWPYQGELNILRW